MISRLATGLRYPLSTLHERCCRHPCKTRFRLAGSAFAGRASNPLGHDERFQITFFLLSRTCPDASWSHLRRQFVKIEREAAPAPAPVAREALERIAQLYAVEKALRGRSEAERRAGRQAHARPLATALKQWFEAKLDHLAQKSDTAKALRYPLRHWDGLTLYLDDGRIEMDTNAVERAMRPIKLNAKNSLFAGCDEGAENWAVLASLIETCKLNGVSAEHWLADVLAKLVNSWPAARLDELLPWTSIYTMHAHDPRLAG